MVTNIPAHLIAMRSQAPTAATSRTSSWRAAAQLYTSGAQESSGGRRDFADPSHSLRSLQIALTSPDADPVTGRLLAIG